MCLMITLIIMRHGNTFGPNDAPRRVGARTDLPLVESGRAQARALGQWLNDNGFHPDRIYTSQLQRTIETAKLALEEAGIDSTGGITPLALFNEVDYGPDENKTEAEVIARLGSKALENWDKQAIVPQDWAFNPEACKAGWMDFADGLVADQVTCALVVTSNGTARFAPYITGDFETFQETYPLKMATGAASVFVFENGCWLCREWNVKPR